MAAGTPLPESDSARIRSSIDSLLMLGGPLVEAAADSQVDILFGPEDTAGPMRTGHLVAAGLLGFTIVGLFAFAAAACLLEPKSVPVSLLDESKNHTWTFWGIAAAVLASALSGAVLAVAAVLYIARIRWYRALPQLVAVVGVGPPALIFVISRFGIEVKVGEGHWIVPSVALVVSAAMLFFCLSHERSTKYRGSVRKSHKSPVRA